MQLSIQDVVLEAARAGELFLSLLPVDVVKLIAFDYCGANVKPYYRHEFVEIRIGDVVKMDLPQCSVCGIPFFDIDTVVFVDYNVNRYDTVLAERIGCVMCKNCCALRLKMRAPITQKEYTDLVYRCSDWGNVYKANNTMQVLQFNVVCWECGTWGHINPTVENAKCKPRIFVNAAGSRWFCYTCTVRWNVKSMRCCMCRGKSVHRDNWWTMSHVAKYRFVCIGCVESLLRRYNSGPFVASVAPSSPLIRHILETRVSGNPMRFFWIQWHPKILPRDLGEIISGEPVILRGDVDFLKIQPLSIVGLCEQGTHPREVSQTWMPECVSPRASVTREAFAKKQKAKDYKEKERRRKFEALHADDQNSDSDVSTYDSDARNRSHKTATATNSRGPEKRSVEKEGPNKKRAKKLGLAEVSPAKRRKTAGKKKTQQPKKR